MLSSLQLKDYRLLKLAVEANEEFISEEKKEAILEIGCDFDVYKSPMGNFFKIPLSLEVKVKKNRRNSNIKKIEMVIEGVFELPQDISEEQINQLVPFNCLAILYGIARGIVADVTGNLQGGKFILPGVNFIELIKKKVQTEKEDKESN